MIDSPVILAVDTTSEFGSVAVRRAHQTAAEVYLQATDGFGQSVFQAIEELLTKAQTQLEEIDCFAAASGPGSFSGVRVGLAAIKGLADALHKPAMGVSNLRALSLSGSSPLRAVVLDARRGQVYGSVYDAQGKIVAEETVAVWEEWLKSVPAGAEMIGMSDGPCHKAGIPFTAAPRSLAGAVAQCAEMEGPSGWSDPVVIDANYVRQSDAQLYWKDR
jgi:tRNA threonylcarbamoyladenosine biosynthesis protein TsaB